MTSEKPKRDQIQADRSERTALLEEVRDVDAWNRSVPVRLAGCEEDPSETHIFRGID